MNPLVDKKQKSGKEIGNYTNLSDNTKSNKNVTSLNAELFLNFVKFTGFVFGESLALVHFMAEL